MPFKSSIALLLLSLFYFFSGAASLAYEIIWMRLLNQQFGVSHFGVAATVAAFMLGLGLGSLWGRRLSHKVQSPLLVLAVIEALVGVYAISLSFILEHVSLVGLSGWVFVDYVIEALMDLVILLPPAVAMGVGFPLILSLLEPKRKALGLLYGANTMGGVFGALVPLYLLPALGWFNANRVIAGVSFVLAAVALVWHLQRQPGVQFHPKTGHSRSQALWVYAGIGFATLLLEIGWSRLFGLLFLRTEYVLALVLAVYLLGIAAGSFVARWSHKPQSWLNSLPLLAAAGILLGLWWVPQIALWTQTDQIISFYKAMGLYTSALIWVCLPVCMVFGAWLPLLQQQYFHDVDSGALLYAANAIGGGAGAFAASFIFFPLVGTAGSIVLAAIIILILGLFYTEWKWKPVVVIVFLVAAVPVFQLPPTSVLKAQDQLFGRVQQQDLYFHEDGISITHVVEKDDGQRLLLSDLQRMDAASDPTSVALQKNQGRLPLMLHHAPERVLYLGLGTGITASAVLAYPGVDATAVELSRGAIVAASEYFSKVNGGVTDDIRIVRADIRRALATDSQRYDVIIGDLFHPDLVGRATLLSLQHFQAVKQRLDDDGLFVQWLALNQFDMPDLKVILRTFDTAFQRNRVYLDGTRIALVGYRGEPADAQLLWERFQQLSAADQDQLSGGEGFWTWMGRYMGTLRVGEGLLQDQWRPVIEYRLPRARFRGHIDVIANLDYFLNQRSTLVSAAETLGVDLTARPAFDAAFRTTANSTKALIARYRQLDLEAIRLTRIAYRDNPNDRWSGFALADLLLNLPQSDVTEQDWLERILKIRPDHMGALRRLRWLYQKQGEQDALKRIEDRILNLHPYEKMSSSPAP